MVRREDISWLRSRHAFGSMSKAEAEHLLTRTEERAWQPGEPIVKRGAVIGQIDHRIDIG